jgi:hypothetical protein
MRSFLLHPSSGAKEEKEIFPFFIQRAVKLVIFGNRSINDMAEVEKAVDASGALPRASEIVSGGASVEDAGKD